MDDLNITKVIKCLESREWSDSYSDCARKSEHHTTNWTNRIDCLFIPKSVSTKKGVAAVECDPWPVVPHATPEEGRNTNGVNYGATVLYECDHRKKAKFEDGSSAKTITCNKHQQWTEESFSCSRECNNIRKSSNSAILKEVWHTCLLGV